MDNTNTIIEQVCNKHGHLFVVAPPGDQLFCQKCGLFISVPQSGKQK